MRQVRAAAELAHRRLSDALRDFLTGNRDLQAKGVEANAAFSDGFLLPTQVSIARLDVKPTLGALAGNPWFVFTQAPFAARSPTAASDDPRSGSIRRCRPAR